MTDRIITEEMIETAAKRMFPFHISGGRIVRSPLDVLFHKHRRRGESWYDYSVQVNSTSSVTFIVYGMLDAIYGGVGPEKYRFDVEDLEDSEELKHYITARATKLLDRVRREIEQREQDDFNAKMAELVVSSAKKIADD